MSTDPELRRKLHRLLDGELSEAEAEQVREAVAADPDLAAEHAELLELREIFRAAPRARASASFNDEVLRRVYETPFRTEVWPQVLPLIQRLAIAAGILVLISLASARVEAGLRPAVLFLPGDPAGITALRPVLDDVGHALVRGDEHEGDLLLRRFTFSPEADGVAGTEMTEVPR